MTHLVIGKGEVGKAIAKIFKADTFDIKNGGMEDGHYDVLHICFPYSETFILDVKKYDRIYSPDIIIVHSTVPIGTTRKLGYKAVHSPVRGVHPNLEEGIRTFVKYIGATDTETGYEVTQLFEEYDLTPSSICDPEDTEAGKLLSTTYYGWNILFEKLVHKFCKDNSLDFDIVYTDFNNTYNDGYKELAMDYVVRPVLKHIEGEIGGHCVIPNCKILDFDPAKIIATYNEEIKKSKS
ncbi:hypothetical protein M0R04_10885 [Candidatus Dojkabacteria bacterium]|nr:hypothetical protein [Candidatus Dojkabacteria bacterium]